jgi:hypothetical protein
MEAIGVIKSKITVFCEICRDKRNRKIEVKIYHNTPQKIEEAKNEIKRRAAKKYTCKICKSILK